MAFKLLLIFCVYPILPILYYVLKLENEPHGGIVFGVTIPADWLQREEISKVRGQYRKELLRNAVIFGLLPFAILPVPYFSIVLTLWMFWLCGMIFFYMRPYVKSNKKLKHIKRKFQAKEGVIRSFEKLEPLESTTRHWVFVVSAAVSLLPAGYVLLWEEERELVFSHVLMILAMLSVILCFWGIGIAMDRRSPEMISEDRDVNRTYAQKAGPVWSKCWAYCGISQAIYTLILGVFLEKYISTAWFLAITVVYCILLAIFCMYAGIQVRNMREKILADAGASTLPDDDSHWIYGMFYFNPNDHRIMVDKRMGIGNTVNMATKTGKGFGIVAMICLLIVPLMCIFLMFEEFTPISLEIQGDKVVAGHIKEEYKIKTGDIQSVEILSSLPEVERIAGTGMETLNKGKFSVEGYGTCSLCLNPENQVFLVIKTSEKTYLFSDVADSDTYDVYAEMMDYIENRKKTE